MNNTVPSNNVAFVQKMYRYFGQGDISSILAAIPAEMEWHIMGAPLLPYAGDFTGATVGAFFQGLGEAFDITEFAPMEFIEQGEQVVALGVIGGSARGTGQAVRSKWVMHWKFRNGQPIYFQDYVDTAHFAAALPTPAPKVGL
jgi:ketosteroid isomerase-like protein